MAKILKKSLAVFLALVCAMSMTVVSLAEVAPTSGQCGDNVFWSFDESTGTLTISGKGEMVLFDGDARPWPVDKIKEIIVEEGITRITERVFAFTENLEKVKLPESILYVEWEIFYNSGYDGYVNDSGVLYEDNILITVTEELYGTYRVLSGTRVIADWPFYNIGSQPELTTVVLPESLVTIGSGAFNGCIGLSSTVIPKSVRRIGDEAYKDCENLKTVTINSGVKAIGERAFSGCFALEEIIIPDTVSTLGQQAFQNCSELKKVSVRGQITQLGFFTFNGCEKLESLDLPKSLRYIDDGAAYGCENLTEINFEGTTEEWLKLIQETECRELKDSRVTCGYSFTQQGTPDEPTTEPEVPNFPEESTTKVEEQTTSSENVIDSEEEEDISLWDKILDFFKGIGDFFKSIFKKVKDLFE